MSKLFSLLSIVKSQSRKDLESFVRMSSNHLPVLDQEIALDILERLKKKRKIDELRIFQAFSKQIKGVGEEQKKNWARSKSRIYQVFLKYFVFKQLLKDPLENILLAEFFYDKGMTEELSSLIKKEQKRLVQTKDFNSALCDFLLQEIAEEQNRNLRKPDNELKVIHEKLDTFYIEKKLRILCEQINRKHVVNKSFDLNPYFLKWLESQQGNLGSVKAEFYFLIYCMLDSENGDNYHQKIWNQLLAPSLQLDTLSIYECCLYLMNFCNKKINAGAFDYADMYLSHVEFLEEKNLLLDKDEMHSIRFRNVIATGLMADKVEWIKAFYLKYKKHLTGVNKSEVASLCWATIQLYEEDYEGCEQTIENYHLKDRFHQFQFEHLRLKLYFYKSMAGDYDKEILIQRIKSQIKRASRSGKFLGGKKERTLSFLKALLGLAQANMRKGLLDKLDEKLIDLDKLYTKLFRLDWVWFRQLKRRL